MREPMQIAFFFVIAIAAGLGGGVLSRVVDDDEPAPSRAVASESREEDSPRVSQLEARIRRLEQQRRVEAEAARTGAGRNSSGGGAAASAAAAAREPARPGGASGATGTKGGAGRVLDGLVGGSFTHARSESLFQRLAENKGAIDATIADLEARLRDEPRSADLWCTLATAYGAKTAFDAVGPDRGAIWAKAEAAYDEAIQLDPNHWEARYGKAFGASMAPEFVGLRPAAVKQFEELMRIQESRSPSSEQVLVYARLGTLYKDAGNVAKAREVWERGAKRFPDDPRLEEMLDLSGE